MTEFLDGLFGIRGRVVLITGGGKGIGYHMAEALVRAGARVYLCSRDGQACEAAAQALSAEGECIGFGADIATAEGIGTVVQFLGEREQALHALFNNAGRSWGAELDAFPEDAWGAVMDLNVKTPFFLVQRLLPLLEAGGSADNPARVINIGSIAGVVAASLNAWSYGPSKAAVHQLTRMLARDLCERHINVNAIAPGWFRSRMTRHLYADDAVEQAHLETVPMARFGNPEEIGALALYLTAPASAYMTGAIIPLDGGVTLVQ